MAYSLHKYIREIEKIKEQLRAKQPQKRFEELVDKDESIISKAIKAFLAATPEGREKWRSYFTMLSGEERFRLNGLSTALIDDKKRDKLLKMLSTEEGAKRIIAWVEGASDKELEWLIFPPT